MKIYSLDDQILLKFSGAKAFNLSLLKSINVTVPNGYVIPVSYYQAYQSQPEQTLNLLKEKLGQLNFSKSNEWMVRSSAIGEDSSSASFAGQLESYSSPNDIDSLIQNIVKCWASANSDRVQSYMTSKKVRLGGVAVLIQKKINPTYSGVLFTQSPKNIDKVALEFVQGHCEKLVKGEVTPTSLELNETYFDQNIKVDFTKLIKTSRKIEKHFGQPQDIEWTYHNNKFSIVQSRPITKPPKKTYWTNTNINENYPGVISPMLFSVAKTSYYHYFKNLCLAFNLIKKNNDFEELFRNAVGSQEGRIYYNMSNISTVINQTALPTFLQKSFNNFIGYQKNKDNKSLKAESIIKKKWKQITFFSLVVARFFILEKHVQKFENRVINFNNDNTGLKSANENIKTFFDIRFKYWKDASYADFYAMIFHGLLGYLCKKMDPKNYFKWHNLLIQGIPNLISKQPSTKIYQIVDTIKSNPQYSELFTQKQKEILSHLNKTANTDTLAKKFLNYIQDWGFRCSGELMLTHENFITNPEKLIKVIKANLKHNINNPEDLFAIELKKFKEGNKQFLDIAESKYPNFIKKYFVKLLSQWVINGARKSIGFRERVRLKQAQAYHLFSQSLRQKGLEMKNLKILQEPKDIYYLTHKELTQYINKKLSGDNFKNIISKRKFTETKQLKTAAPNEFYTIEGRDEIYSLDQSNHNDSSLTLTGLPACSGNIKGQAQIIASIEEIDRIQANSILVTKQTDPGWISVFSVISAIVIENGGMLSHGAIVAREFGIPAVVGVHKATKLIKNNQTIRVNGDLGVIEL